VHFREFWPIYLKSHRHPMTRGAHYLATLVGASSAVVAASPAAPWWVMAGGIGAAYAIAFASHWLIEHNNPCVLRNLRVMTFLLGGLADIRMCGMAISGRITAEYRRLGLGEPRRTPGKLAAGRPLGS